MSRSVVPLTSTLRGYESEVEIEATDANGLQQDSAGQCQHLRAISRSRVGPPLGNVGAVTLMALRDTVAAILDLPA